MMLDYILPIMYVVGVFQAYNWGHSKGFEKGRKFNSNPFYEHKIVLKNGRNEEDEQE